MVENRLLARTDRLASDAAVFLVSAAKAMASRPSQIGWREEWAGRSL